MENSSCWQLGDACAPRCSGETRWGCILNSGGWLISRDPADWARFGLSLMLLHSIHYSKRYNSTVSYSTGYDPSWLSCLLMVNGHLSHCALILFPSSAEQLSDSLSDQCNCLLCPIHAPINSAGLFSRKQLTIGAAMLFSARDVETGCRLSACLARLGTRKRCRPCCAQEASPFKPLTRVVLLRRYTFHYSRSNILFPHSASGENSGWLP